MKKVYSAEIENSIRDFLYHKDYNFEFDDSGLFVLNFRFSERVRNVLSVIDVKEDNFIVYAFFPFTVDITDKDQMQRVSEFIERVNYGLINGNFEINYDDGEIRYKCFVNCKNSELSEAVIEESVILPVLMISKKYGSGFLDVLNYKNSPKNAAKMCDLGGENYFQGESGIYDKRHHDGDFNSWFGSLSDIDDSED